MAKIHKYNQKLNLAKYRVWVEDTDPSSRYFRLSQIPEVLTAGKNAFLINGSTELVPTTNLLLEITDVNGDTIFSQPIRNYVEGLARVVSIEVYKDTPPGLATITILGHLQKDASGTLPPENFVNAFNVRWQKRIPVAPNLGNSTPIRLYQRPSMSVSEVLIPARNAVFQSVTTASVGTVIGIVSTPIPGTSIAPITHIKLSGSTLTRDMIDGTFMASINGTAFTSSISEILNNSTARLSSSFYSASSASPFTTSDFKISYIPEVQYVQNNLTRSFADIRINNLRTFSGDIQRAKIYAKSLDQTSDFVQIADLTLDATELTLTQSLVTGDPAVRMGDVKDASRVSQYWTSGRIVNSSSYAETAATASYNATELLDSVKLIASVITGSTAPQYYLGLTAPLSFTEGLEYTFEATVLCNKIAGHPARMDVYLVGTAFPSSSASPLGIRIASYTAASNETRFKTTASENFLAISSGTAQLRFVIYDGDWYISNVGIFSANEFGFNPDEVRILTPIQGRRFEHLTFRTELFDINNNRVPLKLETENILFDGGNQVIRGTDNRIDGGITVAGYGSGITITSQGYTGSDGTPYPSSSAIYIGSGVFKDPNTPFIVGQASGTATPIFGLGDRFYAEQSGSDYVVTISGTLLVDMGGVFRDVRTVFGSGSGFSGSLDAAYAIETATNALLSSSANLAYSASILTASITSLSSSQAQYNAVHAVVDDLNKIKLPTSAKTQTGLYLESASLGFYNVAQTNYPVVINADGTFRFADTASYVGGADPYTNMVGFVNGSFVVRSKKLLLQTPSLVLVGNDTASAAANTFKLGTNAFGITATSGSGIYLDGTGVMRVGKGIGAGDYFYFDASNGLFMSMSNFFMDATVSASAHLRLNNHYMLMGNSASIVWPPNISNTSFKGFYANREGQFFVGDAAGNYVQFGGQVLAVRAAEFVLATSTINFDSTTTGGSGSIALGTNASSISLNSGAGVWMGGNGTFRAGNPSGGNIKWDGSTLAISGSIVITGGNAATISYVGSATASISSSVSSYANSASSAAQTSAQNFATSADSTLSSSVAGAMITSPIGSIKKVPAPAGSGLFLGSTYMGYYGSSAWQTYISGNGLFQFRGDANNYISWNGSSLTVNGTINVIGGNAATQDDVSFAAIGGRTPSILVMRKSTSNPGSPEATSVLQSLGYIVSESLSASTTIAKGYDIVVIDCSAWSIDEYDSLIQELLKSGSAVWTAGNDTSTGMFFVASSSLASAVGTIMTSGSAHPVTSNWTSILDSDSGARIAKVQPWAIPIGYYNENPAHIPIVEVNHPGGGILIHGPRFGLSSTDATQYRTNVVNYLLSRKGSGLSAGYASSSVSSYANSASSAAQTSAQNFATSADATLSSSVAGAIPTTPIGSIKQPVSPSGNGLYLGSTYIGFYSAGTWQSYISSSGLFQFRGDANNYITWNGSSLTVNGTINVVGGNAATQAYVGSATASVSSSVSSYANSRATTAQTNAQNFATSADTTLSSSVAGAMLTTPIGSIKQPVTPSGAGLFLGSTYMGYYASSTWQTYFSSSGAFRFTGNGSNYISWDGSTLAVRANQFVLNASTIIIDSTVSSGKIALGSATSTGSGNGTWADGTGQFRVGNPSTSYLHWNGSNLRISGSTAAEIGSLRIASEFRLDNRSAYFGPAYLDAAPPSVISDDGYDLTIYPGKLDLLNNNYYDAAGHGNLYKETGAGVRGIIPGLIISSSSPANASRYHHGDLWIKV